MTRYHFYKILSGEQGGDALRNTLATIIPGILIYYFDEPGIAITVCIGALLASCTDMAGSRSDKWLSARWCIPAFGLVSFATALCIQHHLLLIPWLMIVAFACGMLFALGPRISVIGVLALIVASFTIGLWPGHPGLHALWIILGAGWYFLISLLLVYYSPYRSLKYALRRSTDDIAALLKAKALFYDETVTVEKAYETLSILHVKLSEQQDQVRLLLLRETALLQENNKMGQQWLQQLYSMIDLYEVLTAIDHDYDTIRRALQQTNAMEPVRRIIRLLADSVQMMAGSSDAIRLSANTQEIQNILQELKSISRDAGGIAGEVLAATTANIISIKEKVEEINHASGKTDMSRHSVVDYRHFIPASPVSRKFLTSHFNASSDIFRFSIRLALLFGAGGAVGFILPDFRYTYWVLLTIAIVARPTFAVTQARNMQRIKGTVGGLLICIPIVYFIHNTGILLLVAVLALYGFFLFNQPNYALSVLFITVTAIVLLKIHQGAFNELMGSRAFFTVLGAALAIAGWFLVPVRQSRQISELGQAVILANRHYLTTVLNGVGKKNLLDHDIRLSRKRAHAALASFSDTLGQLRTEPGNSKKNWTQELQFQAIAYRSNSLVVGIALSVTDTRRGKDILSHIQSRTSYVELLFRELERLETMMKLKYG